MTIETSTFKATVNSIEELKGITARTQVSDNLAKKFGFDPSNCEICNGALFVYGLTKNSVLVLDFFNYGERKFYDFNVERFN